MYRKLYILVIILVNLASDYYKYYVITIYTYVI